MSYQYTKNSISGEDEIVIQGWEEGIVDNPYKGIADMRNVDNITIPGEVSVSPATQAVQTQQPITGVSFTVDPNTDVFTYDGVIPIEVNTAIIFSNTGGTLPAGISANVPYYILTTPSSTTFTVSGISAGGATLNVTSSGAGTNTFTTIQMGTPKYFASGTVMINQDPNIVYFTVDSNGRCWVYVNGFLGSSNKWVYMNNLVNESITQVGAGLVVYEGYLFWFDQVTVNVISILNPINGALSLSQLTSQLTFPTAGGWYFSWKTTSSTTPVSGSHQAILGVNDNAVYFCNGRYVGSLFTAINQSFNIANTHSNTTDGTTTSGSTTITNTSNFFQSTDVGAIITGTNIPANTTIVSVTNAKTATISNAATGSSGSLDFSITSGYVYNSQALKLPSFDIANCLAELGSNLLIGGINNYIYPWDRVSVSYSNAIFLSENFVSRMVTVNTTTYIFCGYRGRIYVTNGSNVNLYWEVPEYLSNTTNPYYEWTDAIFNRNQLYFGFKVTTNSGTTINNFGGVWSIDLDRGFGTGKLQNILSYNTYAGYASAFVINRGTIITTTPSGDGYGLFIGWNDGSKGGIDKCISTPYTGTQAYVVTDMIPVGNYYTKKVFNNIEFKLATPLVTGESVHIAYRSNLTDAFTDVPVTEGGQTSDLSGVAKNNFQNVQWLQIQATLSSTATNPSFVRLKSLTIR